MWQHSASNESGINGGILAKAAKRIVCCMAISGVAKTAKCGISVWRSVTSGKLSSCLFWQAA